MLKIFHLCPGPQALVGSCQGVAGLQQGALPEDGSQLKTFLHCQVCADTPLRHPLANHIKVVCCFLSRFACMSPERNNRTTRHSTKEKGLLHVVLTLPSQVGFQRFKGKHKAELGLKAKPELGMLMI